ncbi:MAG: hypothetical protein ACJ8R9_20040 [Steroidobacteraceae bacterium]
MIWAAVLVILENYGLQRLLESDLSHVPELTEHARGGRSGGSSRNNTVLTA